MTKSRVGALALLVAAFIVGGIAGGAAVAIGEAKVHPRGRRPGHLERLSTELSLTAAQQDSVQAIFFRHQPLMDSLWREMRRSPQFDTLRAALRHDIRSQLTPEQQEKYTRMIEKLESEYRNGDRRDRGRDGRK